MRVLHITPYFAPAFAYGGPPRSIHGLCRALVRAGIDVEVFTTNANGAAQLPAAPDGVENDGIPVRYFPLAAPHALWTRAACAHRWRSRSRRSTSSTCTACGIGPATMRRVWRAAPESRTSSRHAACFEPEALAIHRRRKAVAWQLFERRHIREAALLHATSARESETLTKRRFGPPIVLAPNGVDAAPFSGDDAGGVLRGLGIEPGARFVLFLGRVHPIKRLDLLAAAAARLAARDVRIVIAGPDEGGHRAAVAPLFAASGLATIWTGAVRRAAAIGSAHHGACARHVLGFRKLRPRGGRGYGRRDAGRRHAHVPVGRDRVRTRADGLTRARKRSRRRSTPFSPTRRARG